MSAKNPPREKSPIGAELDKIRSLPPGKRWEYVWEYYKFPVLGIAFALFMTVCLGSFLVNLVTGTLFAKPAVTVAFADASFENNEEWTARWLAGVDFQEDNETFHLLTTAPHSEERDDFRVMVSVWLANGQPDIFLVDEDSFQYLLELEALKDLEGSWPENLQALAADRMRDPFRVDLTGTAFAQAYRLSDPVYLCMPSNSAGYQRSLDLIEYILTAN